MAHMGRVLRESGAIACAFGALLALLALQTFDIDDPGWSHTGSGEAVANSVGRVGAWFADVAFWLFGYMAYLVPMLLAASGYLLFRDSRSTIRGYQPFMFVRLLGVALMFITASGLADLHFAVAEGSLPHGTFGGGILGTAVAWRLVAFLHHLGTTLLLLALFFCSLTLAFGTSWIQLMEAVGGVVVRLFEGIGAQGRKLAGVWNERRRRRSIDRERSEHERRLSAMARAEAAEERAATVGRVGMVRRTRQIDGAGSTTVPAGVGADALLDDPNADPEADLEADSEADLTADPTACPTADANPSDPSRAAQIRLDTGRTNWAQRMKSGLAGLAGRSEQGLPESVGASAATDPVALDKAAFRLDEKVSARNRQDVPDALLDDVPDMLDVPGVSDQSDQSGKKTAVGTAKPVSDKAKKPRVESASDEGPENVGSDAPSPAGARSVPPRIERPVNEPPLVLAVEAGAAAGRKAKAEKPSTPRQASLYIDVPDSDLPPIALLDMPEPQQPGFSDAELEGLSRLLEEKLAEFRIVVEVVAVHPGPVITRFEMQLAPGIKASRVTGLAQDIARSLSLVSVRVVEVIAGKSTIGIEVPNEHREIVQLSEMLRSRTYVEKKSPLTLALGKDISGQSVTADLGRMPHLLVAGTTGSGKSVAVNSMLISLLYKATAKDVRLILIDPKMLELNVYDGIPHLLAPVVTDMKEAANALRWCVGEMERRYMVMAELKVRGIVGYNKKVNDAIAAGTPIVDPLYNPELAQNPTAPPPTLEPMPFIVVVVDEFADMMMQVGKKAEELIARIAQKARAAGIHLILATQRPSVDVITGLIKANVPTRIAFQVSSKIDSRTIIDQGGAESLLGHGDMLYQPPGSALTQRVHGAFVDDHEVVAVVQHIKQTGEPNYIEEILQENTAAIPGLSGGDGGDDDTENDALYDQAVQIVLESRKASISYVQRRLKIGYNRAARMIEQMEESGVISAVGGSGVREVLAPPPPPA